MSMLHHIYRWLLKSTTYIRLNVIHIALLIDLSLHWSQSPTISGLTRLACSFAVSATILAARQVQLHAWSRTLSLLLRRAILSPYITESGRGAASAAAVILTLHITSGLMKLLLAGTTCDLEKASSHSNASEQSSTLNGMASLTKIFLTGGAGYSERHPDPLLFQVTKLVSECWQTDFEPLLSELPRDRLPGHATGSSDPSPDSGSPEQQAESAACDSSVLQRWHASADAALVELIQALGVGHVDQAESLERKPNMENDVIWLQLVSASAVIARSACSTQLIQGGDTSAVSLAKEGFEGFRRCFEMMATLERRHQATAPQKDIAPTDQQGGPAFMQSPLSAPKCCTSFTRDQLLALRELSVSVKPDETLSRAFLKLPKEIATQILRYDEGS